MSIEIAHQSPRNPLIKGRKIEAGGYTWEMPPLNMRQLRDYTEMGQSAIDPNRDPKAPLTIAEQRAVFDAGINAIYWALQRNYPSLTLDDCLDMVDASTFQPMLLIMQGVSGVVPSGEDLANLTLTNS